MDVSLQVKLLRVLNNGEYRPLGSAETLHTDARIIAASNADLELAIAEGRFREDLYYRINVVNLQIPSLHERPEDIPLLANHFLRVYRKKSRKAIERISPAALSALRKCQFSGNVRELENAIEHAFVMCHGEQIEVEHLPLHITTRSAAANGISHARNSEKGVILESLRRNKGSRVRAAEELGMHRSTLWRKIKTYNID